MMMPNELIEHVANYVAFVAVTGLGFHTLIRNFAAASIVTASIGALGNLAYETWLVNFRVNPGGVVPLLILGAVVALPVSFLVGIPQLVWRRSHRRQQVISRVGNRLKID